MTGDRRRSRASPTSALHEPCTFSTTNARCDLHAPATHHIHCLSLPPTSRCVPGPHGVVRFGVALVDIDTASARKPLRPSLSAHPSHAGYLTLSSPEINAETHPVATATEDIPALSSTSIPQIIEPADQQSLPERNASPVEKLRGAFSLSRNKSADSDTAKSVGSGQGGFAGIFKPSSRRNSFNPEEVAEPQKAEKIPQDAPVPQQAPSEPLSEPNSERPVTPARGRPRVNTESLPATPPNLTDTPTTFVTPPTPTDPHADASTFPRNPPKKAGFGSPSDSIKHRRTQSANIPSKLSQSIPPPLTPTAEEYKTPGGTLTSQQAAGGFFTNFFSAAQKAAGQLSSSINNSGPDSKSKELPAAQEQGGEEVIPGTESRSIPNDKSVKRQSAIETLGAGDLNLGHLGITEEPSPMSSQTELVTQNGKAIMNGDASKKGEEEAAARAVSQAYEKPIASVVSQAQGARPLSIASNDRLTLTGEQTPPRSNTEADGMKRSGSVRSKISGRRRRKRNSSATAGTTNSISAGLAAVGTGLGAVNTSGPGHRLTGFAVASSKRNKDFHQLFRSVPEDDYLIEDYSAALQRDILLHGRLYVSEGHICFSSNILGWVTNLVISFDEVVSVEKKSTAVIFPNAIVISTLHARNTFASFVARDSTYELLIGIWKISHPNLKSSLNGVTLDNAGTGDKTEVADPEGSLGGSESGSDDEVYDEDDDDDDGSFMDAGAPPSLAGSDAGPDPTISRKASTLALNAAGQANGNVPKGLENADTTVTGAAVSSDFPGVPTHEPTQCADDHYDRPITDVNIPAPLGKVYTMMYGPASNAFMRKWLVEDQKSRELNMPDDKIGLDNDHKTMVLDYIKPLSAPVGPKQTKCITTNTLLAFDLEKAVTVDCSTQTPDVPSGNVFTTKTRYCLTWGPANSTRLVATCTIEWTGKSWLKGACSSRDTILDDDANPSPPGPIEKGANDGQIEYVKSLVAAMRAAVTTKPPVKGVARKGKRKGKKEVYDTEGATSQRDAVADEPKPSDWGVFEILRPIFGPFVSLLGPFVTSQTMIAVLFALLIYTWINPPGPRSGLAYPGVSSSDRLVAYEELWRREESNLWDWLEDRAGLDGLYAPGREKDRRKSLAAKGMKKQLQDERMSERQMDDAIRTTEDRLAALKEAVQRKKDGKGR